MWYIKKYFLIDMKFGINQAISQTIPQLPCIQLETPSSRLWNFWWIKTYTTFNVFSSCPPPRPLLQGLLPLTSKPFKLHLQYLGQRIYRSGKIYWLTFPWPLPKVTAVAGISTNLLVCMIKVRTPHPITSKLGGFIALAHGHYLNKLWKSSGGNYYFGKFSFLFQGQISK